MQHTSNLLYAIHAVHQKPKPFQLPFSLYLKGPHVMSRRFQFNESHLAAGEKHNAVRHSIETGRHKFHRQPTDAFLLHSPVASLMVLSLISFTSYPLLLIVCCQRG